MSACRLFLSFIGLLMLSAINANAQEINARTHMIELNGRGAFHFTEIDAPINTEAFLALHIKYAYRGIGIQLGGGTVDGSKTGPKLFSSQLSYSCSKWSVFLGYCSGSGRSTTSSGGLWSPAPSSYWRSRYYVVNSGCRILLPKSPLTAGVYLHWLQGYYFSKNADPPSTASYPYLSHIHYATGTILGELLFGVYHETPGGLYGELVFGPAFTGGSTTISKTYYTSCTTTLFDTTYTEEAIIEKATHRFKAGFTLQIEIGFRFGD